MLKNFMQSDAATPAKPDTPKPVPAPYVAPRPHDNRFSEPQSTAQPVVRAEPVEDGNKLIVGPNIKLKGSEITDCEILVVEGRVEASMHSRDIRIAEGGVFSGKAVIDVAEVRGTFEGDLTARKRLVIYATGKVTGTIRYGAMKIEEGGTLAGDIAMLSAAAPTPIKAGFTDTTAADASATADKPVTETRPAMAKA